VINFKTKLGSSKAVACTLKKYKLTQIRGLANYRCMLNQDFRTYKTIDSIGCQPLLLE